MSWKYSLENGHIVDYELYTLPDTGLTLRGPYWPLKGQNPQISFLGAAQTFGTFCKYPFANLLGEMVSARTLNFGIGGAGPQTYFNRKKILDLVNDSSMCVVQVMSGRSSISNSYMEHLDGGASVIMRQGALAGEKMTGAKAFSHLATELERGHFFEVIEETRDNFIKMYERLANLISVPKILLFVGPYKPLDDYKVTDSVWKPHDLIGVHPHLINKGTLDRIAPYFDEYVQVFGKAGNESKLVNRFTAEYCSIKRSPQYTIVKHDAYISPQLHVQAALELLDPTRRALDML